MISTFSPIAAADPTGGPLAVDQFAASDTAATLMSSATRKAPLVAMDTRDVSAQQLAGAEIRTYGGDVFDRLHISTSNLDLGSVIGLQQRQITIWNAFRRSQTLADLQQSESEGLSIAGGPGALPYAFQAFEEQVYTVTIAADGPPTIDATFTWDFSPYDLVLRVTGSRVTAWSFIPDWSTPILERMEWKTDVIQAFDASEQRSALRLAPRKTYEFEAFFADAKARRYAEAVIWSTGARVWALPIWPDGVDLLEELPEGSISIPADTATRDFTAGALAIIIADATNFETVEILTVGPSALGLKRGTSRAWPSGARVYPSRIARLADSVTIDRWDGAAAGLRASFAVEGGVDYTASAGPATHAGFPVLERRPDWAAGVDLELARKLATLDNVTGGVWVDDEADFPIPSQRMRWLNQNRAEADTHRRLLYALRGRQASIWIPTWASDLAVVSTIASSSQALDVEWLGYTQHLKMAPGRADIRIELTDGTIFYRTITGSAVIDQQTERLQISAALGREVAPADILQISFMTLSRQDSDAVEIAHWTGEASETATTFRGFKP